MALFFPLFSESRFKEKHSLDSDEEDYSIEETETGLGDEDLAAQEDSTVVSWNYRARQSIAMAVSVYISSGYDISIHNRHKMEILRSPLSI